MNYVRLSLSLSPSRKKDFVAVNKQVRTRASIGRCQLPKDAEHGAMTFIVF